MCIAKNTIKGQERAVQSEAITVRVVGKIRFIPFQTIMMMIDGRNGWNVDYLLSNWYKDRR